MDDDGNLSVEGVRKSAEKYLSDDPELLKKSEMFTDACKSGKNCSKNTYIFGSLFFDIYYLISEFINVLNE